MPTGNNDPGDFILRIIGGSDGDFTVEEFTGLDYEPQREASLNEGPAGVAFGFNRQRSSNRVNLTINVRETSTSLHKLYDLADSQEEVKVVAFLDKNKDSYDDDQIVELGAERCVILPGSTSRGGGDAGDVSFSVIGITPISRRKKDLAA